MKTLGKKIEQLLVAATFAEAGEQEAAREILRGERSVVVAVVHDEEASPALAYSISAAQRNGARLDLLLVDRGGEGSARLSARCEELVRSASIPVRLIRMKGTVKDALLEQARREKDILCFVADPDMLMIEMPGMSEASMRRFAETLGKPLVQVEGRTQIIKKRSGKDGAMSSVPGKKKPFGKMLVMGLISVALYAYLLTNQDMVNSTFSKGGWYALLPIVVAFVFSFVHGSFTSDFWTVLGIEAARKKKEVK